MTETLCVECRFNTIVCVVFVRRTLSQLTSTNASSQLATERVDPGELLSLCGRAGALIWGGGNGRNLVLRQLGVAWWRGGGGGRRRGGGWGRGLSRWGLWAASRRGAAGSRLGRAEVDAGVGNGAGQVEARNPGGDGRVEGKLPRPDGGGGVGRDGQRRR